jgi:hypothetical protein
MNVFDRAQIKNSHSVFQAFESSSLLGFVWGCTHTSLPSLLYGAVLIRRYRPFCMGLYSYVATVPFVWGCTHTSLPSLLNGAVLLRRYRPFCMGLYSYVVTVPFAWGCTPTSLPSLLYGAVLIRRYCPFCMGLYSYVVTVPSNFFAVAPDKPQYYTFPFVRGTSR